MGTMKDALLKAGLKGTNAENEREKKPKKVKKNSEKHQYARNFCEVCQLTQPDVERFKHRNALVDAEWICVACADKLMIHDDFRVTAQSDFSLQKKYRRFYGPTHKVLPNAHPPQGKQNNPQNNKKGPPRDRNYNR